MSRFSKEELEAFNELIEGYAKQEAEKIKRCALLMIGDNKTVARELVWAKVYEEAMKRNHKYETWFDDSHVDGITDDIMQTLAKR